MAACFPPWLKGVRVKVWQTSTRHRGRAPSPNRGDPTAIFHPCDGNDVVGITVSQAGVVIASATGDDPSSLSWRGASVDGVGLSESRVRLLAMPPGWIQQVTKPGSLLTAFTEGRTYIVEAETKQPANGRAVGVSFTVGDLRTLADGDVWAVAAPEAFEPPRAMSRDEFDRLADDAC